MKPENVRMALMKLMKLMDLNNKKIEPFDIGSDGTVHELSIDELRDKNFELLAGIADLLGMEDLYRDPGSDDHFAS